MSAPTARGGLVLVATPIGNLADLAPRAVEALRDADVICCEDTRHTGRLLQHVGVKPNRLVSLNAFNEADRAGRVLDWLRAEKLVVLVSDAGTPLASDPGERLVAAAIVEGFSPSIVPGPFAGVAALVLSGFSTERWRFEGFLPRKGPERRSRLAEVGAAHHPSVIYEAPHRVCATLEELAAICGEDRRVALARELTKLHEEVLRGTIPEVLAHPALSAPRGEFVIVVDGAPASLAPAAGEIAAALGQLVAVGLNRRDAVRAVETLLRVPHRDAYQAALELGRPDGSETPSKH